MGKGIMEEVVTDPEKYYAHVYENHDIKLSICSLSQYPPRKSHQ